MPRIEINGKHWFICWKTNVEKYEQSGELSQQRIAEIMRQNNYMQAVGLSKTRACKAVVTAHVTTSGRYVLPPAEGV